MKKTVDNSPYYFSANTFVLISEKGVDGKRTRIIEHDQTLTHARNSLYLLKNACKHYGSSLEVATRHARHVLSNRHKVPVLFAVDHGFPLIMIPTMSANSDENIWIALHAIKNFRPGKSGSTIIQLENDTEITVNASEATMFRQFSLAQILRLHYLMRYKHLNIPGFPRSPFNE